MSRFGAQRRTLLAVRIGAIFCVLSIMYVTACGSTQQSGGGGGAGTELTIRSVNSEVGRAEFHLSCDPPGGDLPDPAHACSALSQHPALVKRPKPFTCLGGTFSWWEIEIRGQLDGEPISTDTSTCWTTQMDMLGALGMDWDVLQAHLLPRRHREVLPETTRVFKAGELDVADEVACDIRGHHLAAGVPEYTDGVPLTVGYDGLHIVPVTMAVERQDDGSVEVACHTGK
jgi:hypothetical protein